MQRIIYIVPGYQESPITHPGYRKLAKLAASYGFSPVHVEIDWHKEKPASFAGYAKQFLKQFKKKRGVQIYVLGFSYGATIAFLTATKTKPAGLILCSLSPYFVEDQKNLEPGWRKFWQENFINSNYEFKQLAPKISWPTYLIVGSEEHHSLLTRARSARRQLKASTLTIAKGARHRIGQKEYLRTIEEVIATI